MGGNEQVSSIALGQMWKNDALSGVQVMMEMIPDAPQTCPTSDWGKKARKKTHFIS